MIGNQNKVLLKDTLETKKGQLEELFKEVMRTFGYDYEKDPNMKETPKRMAKMYMDELFAGCYQKEPKFTIFPNTKKIDQIVYMKDIKLVSTCSHHLVNFVGKVSIGYLPNRLICGASKLVRVVRWFAKRPQIQEELTKQIADYLQKKLKPRGVGVIIEAKHYCMIARGVEEENAVLGTSEVLGAFRKDRSLKDEFLRLIGR